MFGLRTVAALTVTVLVIALVCPIAFGGREEFGEWITLFNGKDLTGWQNIRAPGEENKWTVEDGSLTNISGGVNDIGTIEKWKDFELHLQYKIVEHSNSGVYLRGRTEIQVLDSHGKRRVGTSDDGAIYGQSPPKVNASNPAGEWNTLDARFIDGIVYVVLNGKVVQDNVLLKEVSGGALPGGVTDPGPLRFQGDHGKVWYRDIKIRPLFGEGWRRLFNLEDCEGWVPHELVQPKPEEKALWTVENGIMTNMRRVPNIGTVENFGDFLLHYEYKALGNSGVFLRGLWEIQIDSSYGKETPSKQDDGALYDCVAPKTLACKPPGQWNVVEVKVVGRKITAYQNGQLIHDESEFAGRTYNKSDSSNLDAPGPLVLQGDHGKAWFANIWIKPLD